jgi:hypothetical protein
MFEIGEYAEVIEDINTYLDYDRKVLAFQPGDVVQLNVKSSYCEGYIVYSPRAECNVLIYERELQKPNKNDVTIVMRK